MAAAGGPLRGRPLRRHGAGPAGRRHLLPLPDAAEPRPRRGARAADGEHGSADGEQLDAAGGAAGWPTSTGAGSTKLRAGDRDRDPPPPGRGPRRRGAGPLGPQAPARGHRRHARHPRRAGRRCGGPSTRSPASWRCAWPASAGTGAGGRSTSGPPCAGRSSTGGVPVEPALPPPAPGQARDLRDRRHLGLGGLVRPLHPAPRATPSARSSPRSAASSSSTASTR